jgi:hypothetical protein
MPKSKRTVRNVVPRSHIIVFLASFALGCWCVSPQEPQCTSLGKQGGERCSAEGGNHAQSLDQSSDEKEEDRARKGTDHHTMEDLTSSRRSLEVMDKDSEDGRKNG